MENFNVRRTAVAGQFYPATASEIRKLIDKYVDKQSAPKEAIAAVLPHAGYIYSGKVAVETVCSMQIKEKVILIGPNHTGYGAEFSLMGRGAWKTPMGDVAIDDRLAGSILTHSKHLQDDTLAHVYEHSLEVQLPILQYFRNDFSIVPIVLASNQLDALKETGREIAESIISLGLQKSVLIIASSDMTHYESQQAAERKDQQALQAILQLNEDALMDKIIKMKISMCGYAPVITAISAAKALGAQKAVLVKYQTSGDVTHDKESVVGYAGVIIS